MLKSVWQIVRKECSRFFGDPRTVLIAIVMPALMLYAMYGLLGDGMAIEEDYKYKCEVQHMPENFEIFFEGVGFEATQVTDAEAAKENLESKQTDLFVIFPEDFEAALEENSQTPNIQVYFNSNSNESNMAYGLFTTAAQEVEDVLANVWDINRDVENPDVARTSMVVTFTLPMMIMFTLFIGCSSLGPESIAGEKERGTIATLLVTPINRTAIAIGKVGSLFLFALLAALSCIVGLMLSLPNALGAEFDMSIYGAEAYGSLLCVMVTTVLLMSSAVSVLSANAKSVKEATSGISVIVLVGSMVGMIPQLFDFSGAAWRFVPILNCALCLDDIFSLKMIPANILITCLANIVYTVGLVTLLSKMFNSEKIMFNK